jgi:hypothetical protein
LAIHYFLIIFWVKYALILEAGVQVLLLYLDLQWKFGCIQILIWFVQLKAEEGKSLREKIDKKTRKWIRLEK